MNYPEEFQEYVARVVHVVRRETYHGETTFRYTFEEKASESDTDFETTYFQVQYNTVYNYARIWVYPEALKAWSRGEHAKIARLLTHEVCHLFFERLRQWAICDAAPSTKRQINDDLESSVEKLAKVIFDLLDLLPEKWYDPAVLAAECDKSGGKVYWP